MIETDSPPTHSLCDTCHQLQLYQEAYSKLLDVWLEHQERLPALLENYEGMAVSLKAAEKKASEWMKISQAERTIVETLRARNETMEQGLAIALKALKQYVPAGERSPLYKQLEGYL